MNVAEFSHLNPKTHSRLMMREPWKHIIQKTGSCASFLYKFYSTTAVKAIWKLHRPLYSLVNRHFRSLSLCHAIDPQSSSWWGNRTEKTFVFLFHIVANKRPYLHYTSLYQLLVFTNVFAMTKWLRWYIGVTWSTKWPLFIRRLSWQDWKKKFIALLRVSYC